MKGKWPRSTMRILNNLVPEIFQKGLTAEPSAVHYHASAV